MSEKYEVTGHDKDGCKVFDLLVEAPNEIVAKLYAAAHQRTPDGAEALMSAVNTEVKEYKIPDALRNRIAAIQAD